jgi:hypothetical protein
VGATGVLRVLDPPGGAVYLTDGLISYAESPPACGADRLLTASGRLSAEAWRAALAAGRAERRVGEELVRQGLVTPAELEVVVLSALYGAALFLFQVGTDARFEMGLGHPLGPVVGLGLSDVCAELVRRRRVLEEAHPDPAVDTHAVVPARRLAGHHVALTALQWEIVANADRRRTPLDLARSLGRDTYATLLEARRLARAGLIEPGRPGTRGGRARDAPADDEPAEEQGLDERVDDTEVVDPEPDAAVPGPGAARSGGEDGGRDEAPLRPLPRRDIRTPPWGPMPEWEDAAPCSESTLLRIRDALQAMR